MMPLGAGFGFLGAMAAPSLLGGATAAGGVASGLGGLLKGLGKGAVGAQMGPMGLGPDVLSGLGKGQMPSWGNLNAMQRGSLLGTMVPKVEFNMGDRFRFSPNPYGGSGLSQALLMSQFFGGRGASSADAVNPQVQTQTARRLMEPGNQMSLFA